MKGPVDVTLSKVTPRRPCWWYYDADDVYGGEVGVVRIGRDLAVVETTFSNSDAVTEAWLRSLARGRRRAPLIAVLVALCLGGSHVLVYRPDDCSRCLRVLASGRIRFVEDENNMAQLRAFLDDKRITVACLGAAGKLAEEWGLHVARPAELTDLFARAYGKAAAGVADAEETLWIVPERYRMGRPPLFARTKARTRTEAEEGAPMQGRQVRAAARRGPTLERMARVALGPEMRMKRSPAKTAEADWGGSDLSEEEWLHGTRDAFLCFEVAARCLQKLGIPIGA